MAYITSFNQLNEQNKNNKYGLGSNEHPKKYKSINEHGSNLEPQKYLSCLVVTAVVTIMNQRMTSHWTA